MVSAFAFQSLEIQEQLLKKNVARMYSYLLQDYYHFFFQCKLCIFSHDRETNVPSSQCSAPELYYCSSDDKCIVDSWRCDGTDDCSDGEGNSHFNNSNERSEIIFFLSMYMRSKLVILLERILGKISWKKWKSKLNTKILRFSFVRILDIYIF